MTAFRDLILRGGCVLTMDGARRVLPRGDVLVSGGRIAGIGERIETLVPVETLDCEGCVVLPGLVQAHVHLCQTLARGRSDDATLLDWLREMIWPYEAALDEAALEASARLGCAELLLGGTTAILDMGTVHHQDAVFRACAAAGIRATSGKAMMDLGDGVPAGLRERTEDSLRESEALAARWHGAEEGRLRYAYAPRFALSCTEALLRQTAEAARARDLIVHTHASENRDECAAVEAQTGMSNVDYLGHLGLLSRRTALAHAIWLTMGERVRVLESGASLVHCPSANLKLGSGIAPIPEMLDQGIAIALGADGAPCNNNLDAFVEMRLAALLHRPRAGVAAMGAQRALELATRGGAHALALEDEIGSIETGKRADLCVVDVSGVAQSPRHEHDPYGSVVYASSSRDVKHVLVEGRAVVRDRALTTLEIGEVRARAREASDRLFS